MKTTNGKEFCPIFKLLHNYRSLPSILNYYNTQFYGSTLVPMIDDKTSSDAKLLAHVSRIFSNKTTSSDYGIYFADVNGKNVDRKHSWANIRESEVVCGFHGDLFMDFMKIISILCRFFFISNRLRLSLI